MPGRQGATPKAASDPQAGFLEDARREQHVAALAVFAQQFGDHYGFFTYFVTRSSVHHRKQVVRPGWQGARTTVAVGHKRQTADASTKVIDARIRHIPDGHAIGCPADRVVVRHGANAANDAGIEHGLQTAPDFLAGNADLQDADLFIVPRIVE